MLFIIYLLARYFSILPSLFSYYTFPIQHPLQPKYLPTVGYWSYLLLRVALVMAEALGPSNATQIVDQLPTGYNANIYALAYSIYEGGASLCKQRSEWGK